MSRTGQPGWGWWPLLRGGVSHLGVPAWLCCCCNLGVAQPFLAPAFSLFPWSQGLGHISCESAL